jgi:Concanavalin A-like lectin/glucanases superfamily/CARDB
VEPAPLASANAQEGTSDPAHFRRVDRRDSALLRGGGQDSNCRVLDQIENNPWEVALRNIGRLTGQTMHQITGQAPVPKTLISPVTGVVQTRTTFRSLSQEAFIRRRYTHTWQNSFQQRRSRMKTPGESCRFLFASVGCAFFLFTGPTIAAPDQYANEVKADHPIAYWRLGETPGQNVAHDETANHQDGEYSSHGVTLAQPGIHGGDTAVLFDGLGPGRVVVPNSVTLNPANITMEAKVVWLGPNPTNPNTQQRILEKSFFVDPGQEEAQYSLTINPDGHIQAEIRTGLCNAAIDPRCAINPTPPGFNKNVITAVSRGRAGQRVETHIAVTFDGQNVRFYLNGVFDSMVSAGPHSGPIEAVLPVTPPDPTRFDQLGIGNQSHRDRPFFGLIDEATLFDEALSEDRIKAHFEAQTRESQYAAKFVCGVSPGSIVAPGNYFTAINVHNPNAGTVTYKKKFAVAVPGKPGPIRWQPDQTLRSDEALEIDCPEILNGISTTAAVAAPRFAKGFVVLESPSELDVVAVYTAAGATGKVETMELERVPKRAVQGGVGKPDLVPVPQCNRQGDTGLLITIKNQGTANAGPSKTVVDFGPLGVFSQPTPGIVAGGSVDVPFTIPAHCFNPDCHYKITADAGNDVDESDEANNSAASVCLG